MKTMREIMASVHEKLNSAIDDGLEAGIESSKVAVKNAANKPYLFNKRLKILNTWLEAKKLFNEFRDCYGFHEVLKNQINDLAIFHDDKQDMNVWLKFLELYELGFKHFLEEEVSCL